jgi:hypothetical protein
MARFGPARDVIGLKALTNHEHLAELHRGIRFQIKGNRMWG